MCSYQKATWPFVHYFGIQLRGSFRQTPRVFQTNDFLPAMERFEKQLPVAKYSVVDNYSKK